LGSLERVAGAVIFSGLHFYFGNPIPAARRRAHPFTLFHSGVERLIEFFGQGKKWRGFCNFVPEFFIDAQARVVKILCSVYNFIWKQKIMAVKVAINGFGRIGRLVFRALVEQGMVGK